MNITPATEKEAKLIDDNIVAFNKPINLLY